MENAEEEDAGDGQSVRVAVARRLGLTDVPSDRRGANEPGRRKPPTMLGSQFNLISVIDILPPAPLESAV